MMGVVVRWALSLELIPAFFPRLRCGIKVKILRWIGTPGQVSFVRSRCTHFELYSSLTELREFPCSVVQKCRSCRSLVHLSVEQGTYAVGSTPTGAHIANLIGTFYWFLVLAVNYWFFSDVKPSGSRPARERSVFVLELVTESNG